MRVLRPAPHILAFYDGRTAAPGGDWLSECLRLGIASYAVISGNEALIYDTHLSVGHAEFIRNHLEALGVDRFVVVLSHWHIDHVAGTDIFADSTIIASKRTAEHLALHKVAFEAGSYKGPPAIKPLVMPTHVYERGAHIHVGKLHIDLIQLNIHSDDATVVHLKSDGILLAGDTLEDPVIHVGEPDSLAAHLADLDRLAALNLTTILPNHGDPDRIASGGYPPALIASTQDYLWKLLASKSDPALRAAPLQDWLQAGLSSGTLTWFAPYLAVHSANLEAVARL